MGIVKIHGNDILAFRLALDAGARTSTGLRIKTFLSQGEREYDVVILSAGEIFGQMMTKDDPDGEEVQKAKAVYERHTGTRLLPRPTVFWCPDYEFEYFGDVDGIRLQTDGSVFPRTLAELRPGDYYYQYKVGSNLIKVPVVRYTKGKMPPWVVLYHELGHVKQYFQAGVNNKKNTSQLDDAWRTRLSNTDAIEAENLADHENPICVETGLSERRHYKHMGNGMYRVIEAYAGKKAPALRVASDPRTRVTMDQQLRASLQTDTTQEGFFVK